MQEPSFSHIAQIPETSVHFRHYQEMREGMIGFNPGAENDIEQREALRDMCSYNIGFYHNNHIVGGVRACPLGHQLTFTETNCNIADHIREPLGCFEAGRLVLHESARTENAAYQYLQQSIDWMARNTDCHTIVAATVQHFLSLYQRLSFALIHEFNINGKGYYLISKEISS